MTFKNNNFDKNNKEIIGISSYRFWDKIDLASKPQQQVLTKQFTVVAWNLQLPNHNTK